MVLFDPKYKRNRIRYVLQTLLAATPALLLLLVRGVEVDRAVLGAVAASSFIAFTIPHAQVSRPRFLIGSYIVAAAAGSLCYWSARWLWPGFSIGTHPSAHAAISLAAVALCMFVMVVTGTEHPPAVGIALGLVLAEGRGVAVAAAIASIAAISILRALLKPILRNLV